MTQPIPNFLAGTALAEARAGLREKLITAGVVTVRFISEAANDGGFWASQAVLAKRDGAVEADPSLNALVTRVLSALVDERVPGWSAGDGGRSQIDWAVEVDAIDHRHYDNVKFERQRVLGAETSAHSSTILADNAVAAVQLALGGVAPTDRATIQRLRDGLVVLVDRTRTDQARFLTDAQRELLVEGIAGTRTVHGHEQEWISDVVRHGYHGYEHAPDAELVQKLATESLDDVIEGICGPLHIVGGSDQEQSKRHSLIELFSMPQSREALEAVAETWGDAMLQSLPEPEEDEEAVGLEAPAA
ncbi:hypothetical protein [Variovorax sp. JS1663]|uniref:hypothetical protein n=1 Tax=Variovorax sp. JS1663 TaxID=1851577 RepID=UPI000B347A98|nr:hypothetical protein [Variovorax sp. JS1663]OUM04468.1 hypothetical protein A8M77_01820 [Variovorax sp. JS1663]